jgi:hypothetical protein
MRVKGCLLQMIFLINTFFYLGKKEFQMNAKMFSTIILFDLTMRGSKPSTFFLNPIRRDLATHFPNKLWEITLFETYDILHTYYSRFIPEGVAEASQKFLRDAYVLPKLLSFEEYCRGGKLWSQSTSGVSASVAFYDIHRRNKEILLFWHGHHAGHFTLSFISM